MIILVLGGSGSGKSSFAESQLEKFAGSDKYYIATMRIFDEEGRRKVQRHRKMRSQKGFYTIESPVDIYENCTANINKKENVNNKSAILECISNLVANEMFQDSGIKSENDVVIKVTKQIAASASAFDNFVIVSNNIFDDGIDYDDTTKHYISAMGKINSFIADIADIVYEVVAGIPLRIK